MVSAEELEALFYLAIISVIIGLLGSWTTWYNNLIVYGILLDAPFFLSVPMLSYEQCAFFTITWGPICIAVGIVVTFIAYAISIIVVMLIGYLVE